MANDQRFLSDALPQLKDYLLSNEIFWNLGSDPQMTLGNVLIAEANLAGAGKLNAADKQAIADAKKEWRSAWEKKAEKEFAARLRQWMNYVSELGEKPSQHTSYYSNEVRARVLLELLAGEAPGLSNQLSAADNALRSLTTSGDFVWNDGLESAYPKSKYWFLYVKVK